MTVHPIEAQSYRILARRVDLSRFGAGAAAVVARVIHASADVEYAPTMVVGHAAVDAGVAALRDGAPVVTDVEMVAAGIAGVTPACYLGEATATDDLTRSAAGLRIAAERHPDGAVVVVGCAPTALAEAVRLWADGAFRPAMVVGLPVGFVGAAEAKEALRAAGPALPSISNVGEKGGSAVAAAAVNALVRLAAACPNAVPAACPNAVPAACPNAVPAACPNAVPAAGPDVVPADGGADRGGRRG